VMETLEGCSVDAGRIRIVGEPVPVAEGQTMALNLILHELCTNAVKHGALSVASGRVEVSWSTEETEGSKQVRLVWSESGGPDVQPPKRKGFGIKLIKRLVPHELNGETDVRYETGGFQCELVFPLEQS
jgi:two-component sensor histidine kinase